MTKLSTSYQIYVNPVPIQPHVVFLWKMKANKTKTLSKEVFINSVSVQWNFNRYPSSKWFYVHKR